MSSLAMTQNFTSHTYSAYQITTNITPIIGMVCVLAFLYVIIFQRNVLTRLLLGYVMLAGIGVALFLLYVFFNSLESILGFAWSLFGGVGETVLRIPWKYALGFFVTLPLAYCLGNWGQKYVAKYSEEEVPA